MGRRRLMAGGIVLGMLVGGGCRDRSAPPEPAPERQEQPRQEQPPPAPAATPAPTPSLEAVPGRTEPVRPTAPSKPPVALIA